MKPHAQLRAEDATLRHRRGEQDKPHYEENPRQGRAHYPDDHGPTRETSTALMAHVNLSHSHHTQNDSNNRLHEGSNETDKGESIGLRRKASFGHALIMA